VVDSKLILNGHESIFFHIEDSRRCCVFSLCTWQALLQVHTWNRASIAPVTIVYHWITSLNMQAMLNHPQLAHSQRCLSLRAHIKPKSASQTARQKQKCYPWIISL